MRFNRKQRHSPEGSDDETTDAAPTSGVGDDGERELRAGNALGDDDLPGGDADGVDSGAVSARTLSSGAIASDLPDDLDDLPLSGSGSPRGSGDTLVGDRVVRPRPLPSGDRDGFRPREFLHEVNVELRKVVWPTRQETINYSSVVFVTLAVLMALIFGLDYGFDKFSIFLFK